jgi:WD40 repeat protein
MFIYQSHADNIFALSWSPDGRYLASGGADETVRIWQAPAGRSAA